MSKTIDERIVEMKFDNSNFERNVSTSMSTLEKLKNALKFKEAGDGLQNIGNAVSKLNFNGLAESVESISSRFSTMGIVGMTAIQDITRAAFDAGKKITSYLYDPIVNGGKRRAFNIEEAKFQLSGLGIAWEKVKDDIDYAVSGTAYGLDAAAKACAQLSASGVKAGEDMKKALRGISGVAAMTNSDYESIAHVFTTVAGNGKLMAEQLNMLSARGINAAATLAKYLNVSEAELRAMVSDGKIQFDLFATAMDEAFGEHAKDANKTVTGTISNIKAAFAKIGANFFQPIIENEGPLTKFLNSIREKISEFKDLSADFVGGFLAGNAIKLIEYGTKLIDGIKLDGVKKTLSDISTRINKIISDLQPLLKTAKTLFDALRNIGSAIGNVFNVVKKTLISDFNINLKSVVKTIDGLANTIKKITESIKAFSTRSTTVNTIRTAVENISKTITNLFEAISKGKGIITTIFGYAKDGIEAASSNSLSDIIVKISEGLVNISDRLKEIVESVSNFVTNGKNAENITKIFEGLWSALELCIKGFNYIKEIGVGLFDKIFAGLFDISEGSSALSEILDFFGDIADVITDLNKGLITVDELIDRVAGKIVNSLKIIKDALFSLIRPETYADYFGNGIISGIGKSLLQPLNITLNTVSQIIKEFTGMEFDVAGILKPIYDIIDSIQTAFKEGTFLESFGEFKAKFKELFDKLFETADEKDIGDAIIKGLTIFKERLQKVLKEISDVIEKYDGVTLIADIFTSLGEALVSVFNFISSTLNMISSLFDGLRKEFADNPFMGLIKILNTAEMAIVKTGFARAIYQIMSQAYSLRAFLPKLPTIHTAIRTFLNNLGGTIGAFNRKLNKEGNANVFKTVAQSILILSAALLILNFVDVDTIGTKLAVLSVLLGELTLVAKAFTNMMDSLGDGGGIQDTLAISAGFASMVSAISAIAFSVGVLTAAMKKLDGMDPEAILDSFLVVSGLLLEIYWFMKSMNGLKPESFLKPALSIGIISIALSIMASSMVKIGKNLDWKQALVSIIAIGLLLEGLIEISGRINELKAAQVGGLLVLAVAVGILSKSLAKLGSLSWPELGVGLSATIGLLGGLVLATRMLKDSGLDMKTGVAMALMAASFRLLAGSLTTLANIDGDQLAQGWLALTAVMIELLGVMAVMPETSIQTAVALFVVALALGAMTSAISSLGELDLKVMGKGLLGLAGILLALGIATKAMSNSLEGGATILLACIGLYALANALEVLAPIQFKSLAKGLVVIAGSLFVLWMALKSMANPEMLFGAAALLAASVGLMAISAALSMLSGLNPDGVIGGILALATVLIILGVAADAIVASGTILALFGIAAALVLIAASVAIAGMGLMFATSALAQLAMVGPDAANALKVIAKTIADNVTTFIKAAGALEKFSAGLLVLALATIACGVSLIALGAGLIVVGAGLLVIAIGIAAIAGAVLLAGAAFAALLGQFDAFTESLDGFAGDFAECGGNLLRSFLEGLTGVFGEVLDAVKRIGKKLLDGFLGIFDFGDESSGNNEAYEAGKSVAKDYQKGLEDGTKDAKKETEKSGNDLLDTFKGVFTGKGMDASSIMGDMDVKKIVGDMDMSSIMGGNTDMSSMMGVTGLNENLDITKVLTGDSALNIQGMADGSANTEEILEQMGMDSDILAQNTGEAAGNLEEIQNMDFANVEALSDANVKGLTDSKTQQELQKTKENVEAINKETKKEAVKTVKLDISNKEEFEKAVQDTIRGKYKNGKDRQIMLGINYGKIQNEVNKRLGSSKRYKENFDYSTGKTAEEIAKNEEVVRIVYDGTQTADELRKVAEAYRQAGQEVKIIFDKIPSASYAKSLTDSLDMLPTSEKEKVLAILEEYRKLTDIWNGNIQDQKDASKEVIEQNDKIIESTQKVTKYYEDASKAVHAYGQDLRTKGFESSMTSGSLGQKDANDSDVRKSQKDKLENYKQIVAESKDIFDEVDDLLNRKSSKESPFGILLPSEETMKKAFSYLFNLKEAFKMNKEAGTPTDWHLNDSSLADVVRSFYNKKDAEVDPNKLKNSARGAFKNAFDALNKEFESNKTSIDLPVEADTDQVKQVPQTIEKTIQSTKTQQVNIPVKADTKEVTGIPTQVQQAMKDAKQVNIPVKADSTQVKSATTDVTNLKKTTDSVKDKKVTLTADTKGATAAVDQFGKTLTKMSQSIDVEVSKSKQSFSKFYTALQQTINTYTPTIVSNFKQTFVDAVNRTVSYLKSGEVMDQFKQIGVNMGKGMAEGLRSQVANVKAAAKQISNAAASASKKALDEHSPSRVFHGIGYLGGVGLAEGFEESISLMPNPWDVMAVQLHQVKQGLESFKRDVIENTDLSDINNYTKLYSAFDQPQDKLDVMLKSMKDNLAKVGEEINSQLNNNMDLQPTIRPVIDMTNIDAQAGSINSLFGQQQVASISADFNMSKEQQSVQDQQMLEQMILMNQNFAALQAQLNEQEPVPVDVNVTLQGDSRKFFTAMREESARYTQTTGKLAFQ